VKENCIEQSLSCLLPVKIGGNGGGAEWGKLSGGEPTQEKMGAWEKGGYTGPEPQFLKINNNGLGNFGIPAVTGSHGTAIHVKNFTAREPKQQGIPSCVMETPIF